MRNAILCLFTMCAFGKKRALNPNPPRVTLAAEDPEDPEGAKERLPRSVQDEASLRGAPGGGGGGAGRCRESLGSQAVFRPVVAPLSLAFTLL